MDAYTLYEYCHKQNIVPFIDLKKQKQMAPVTKMISLIQENNTREQWRNLLFFLYSHARINVLKTSYGKLVLRKVRMWDFG